MNVASWARKGRDRTVIALCAALVLIAALIPLASFASADEGANQAQGDAAIAAQDVVEVTYQMVGPAEAGHVNADATNPAANPATPPWTTIPGGEDDSVRLNLDVSQGYYISAITVDGTDIDYGVGNTYPKNGSTPGFNAAFDGNQPYGWDYEFSIQNVTSNKTIVVTFAIADSGQSNEGGGAPNPPAPSGPSASFNVQDDPTSTTATLSYSLAGGSFVTATPDQSGFAVVPNLQDNIGNSLALKGTPKTTHVISQVNLQNFSDNTRLEFGRSQFESAAFANAGFTFDRATGAVTYTKPAIAQTDGIQLGFVTAEKVTLAVAPLPDAANGTIFLSESSDFSLAHTSLDIAKNGSVDAQVKPTASKKLASVTVTSASDPSVTGTWTLDGGSINDLPRAADARWVPIISGSDQYGGTLTFFDMNQSWTITATFANDDTTPAEKIAAIKTLLENASFISTDPDVLNDAAARFEFITNRVNDIVATTPFTDVTPIISDVSACASIAPNDPTNSFTFKVSLNCDSATPETVSLMGYATDTADKFIIRFVSASDEVLQTSTYLWSEFEPSNPFIQAPEQENGYIEIQSASGTARIEGIFSDDKISDGSFDRIKNNRIPVLKRYNRAQLHLTAGGTNMNSIVTLCQDGGLFAKVVPEKFAAWWGSFNELADLTDGAYTQSVFYESTYVTVSTPVEVSGAAQVTSVTGPGVTNNGDGTWTVALGTVYEPITTVQVTFDNATTRTLSLLREATSVGVENDGLYVYLFPTYDSGEFGPTFNFDNAYLNVTAVRGGQSSVLQIEAAGQAGIPFVYGVGFQPNAFKYKIAEWGNFPDKVSVFVTDGAVSPSSTTFGGMKSGNGAGLVWINEI